MMHGQQSIKLKRITQMLTSYRGADSGQAHIGGINTRIFWLCC